MIPKKTLMWLKTNPRRCFNLKEIIAQIIEEILPVVTKQIEAGDRSINVHHLISTHTSKPIRQWEQELGAISSHQTVLVSKVGKQLESILQNQYLYKNIKFKSSWGQDGKINIF